MIGNRGGISTAAGRDGHVALSRSIEINAFVPRALQEDDLQVRHLLDLPTVDADLADRDCDLYPAPLAFYDLGSLSGRRRTDDVEAPAQEFNVCGPQRSYQEQSWFQG